MERSFTRSSGGLRGVFALAACWCFGGSSLATDLPLADVPAAFEQHVRQLKADFAREHPENLADIEWVKKRIALLAQIDQYGRTVLIRPMMASAAALKAHPDDAAALELNKRAAALFTAMDAENTAELKRLMARWGWFTSASFDAQTENSAWLIVQHADADREFQRQVLNILEPLVRKGEAAEGKSYAYLFDRVAASFSDPAHARLQRYGTQGRCVGPGQWEPFPSEDPEHLDERRKAMGLSPEADYVAVFKERNVCTQSDFMPAPKANP